MKLSTVSYFKVLVLIAAIAFFGMLRVMAQVQNPIKWTYTTNVISDNEVELVFKATLEKGWHVYSQFLSGNDGPIPTSFHFTPSADYELEGKTEEGTPIKRFEPAFGVELSFFEKEAVFKQKIKLKSHQPFSVKGDFEAMLCSESMCLPPETIEFEFKLPAGEKKKNDLLASTSSTDVADSLLVIFFLGFLGGFAALITPCVFPMIPLTVSFFSKQKKTGKRGLRNTFIYGLSIVIIYVTLGFLITVLLGPNALNALSSNEWMNLLFFLIFIVFGISFLGAFEISLPSSWINKADKVSERGGLIGIFFMAFTLSLVSFSCTGPIIGSLLVKAAVGGNYIAPVIGMLGFAIALAFPFTLFAAFPGWLSSLPKSGGWLNNVKVVLGLLEIAFALKFLSIVDLAGLHIESIDFHINGPLGILKREVFIALWVVIFMITGFYLLGKIKFSHDSEVKFVSIPKLLLAIIAFSFVTYIIPGMWGAPLKMISGFLPPSFYSEGWNNNNSGVTMSENAAIPSSIHNESCPQNLNCFHDYDQALAYAKKENKPLLIDFTGWACVNCRKMEEKVWSDPAVLERLSKDYVLVSLYVDNKNALPENEKYISIITGKNIKTIGGKWSDFQTSRFKRNSQPWYVLLDHEEKELTQARGYDTDIEKYIEFLDEGKKEFENRNKNRSTGNPSQPLHISF